jgi:hypothetical protein
MKIIRPILIGLGILVAIPIVLISAFSIWWMAPSFFKPARPAWVSDKAVAIYDDKQGWHWEQCIDTLDGSVTVLRAPLMYEDAERLSSVTARLTACKSHPVDTVAENVMISGGDGLSVPGPYPEHTGSFFDTPCPVSPSDLVLDRVAAVFQQAALSSHVVPRDASSMLSAATEVDHLRNATLALFGFNGGVSGGVLHCKVVSSDSHPETKPISLDR